MPFIERLEKDFHPDRQHTFKHNLASHPLFTIEELTKLALRNPKVRFHSAKLEKTQRFDTARIEHVTGLTLEETLRNIEVSGSFVYIMEIEKDPIYGPLINEIFEEIKHDVLKYHKKMCKPQAWIFITSPGGTTPYHRDFEANHYFHIAGKKTLWLWDPKDREVVSQIENEVFHGTHSLVKTTLTEEKTNKASQYELSPTNGVFFPYTAPHMVQNGNDGYAISFSITHMTPENYHEKRIHKINLLLRKLRINPSDYQESKIKNTFKLGIHWFLRTVVFSKSSDWDDR